MQDEALKNKFVAVLNKKIPVGMLMNGLAHMCAGISAGYEDVSEMRFDSYFDKDGGEHKSISDHPFIVLKADNSNKIRNLRSQLIDEGVHFVDFTDTMTVGTYEEQKERTKQTSEEDLEYYGIVVFGEIGTVSRLTKKFSLWK